MNSLNQETIKRKDGESILQYYSRLKDNILDGLIELEKSEIYALLYGENVSPDHARKALRVLDLTLEAEQNICEVNPDGELQLPNKVAVEINKDGSQSSCRLIKMTEENSKDCKFLLESHGYDSSVWEIVSAKSSIWDANTKKNGITQLYSSKITIKPKIEGIDLNKLEKWFCRFESKKIDLKQYEINKSNENCLVLPIADLHFNLLSTAFISGGEYNKQIATENFYKIVSDTCRRIKDKNISKILLVLGNDMFNSDGINGCTFKGTPQTDEGHIFEAYIQLSEIVINAINTLSDIAMVDVIFVPSNHDKETAYYFMFTIHTYFRNHANVNVDYSPLPRKYYKFGNTLFMFTHDMKINDVAKTFLDEGGENLIGIEYYECMLAHLHTEIVKQDKNLTIRRLPTSSSNSTWANDNDYSAKRVHQSFIFNDKTSISDCMYISV